jgi:hypothetical protein
MYNDEFMITQEICKVAGTLNSSCHHFQSCFLVVGFLILIYPRKTGRVDNQIIQRYKCHKLANNILTWSQLKSQ